MFVYFRWETNWRFVTTEWLAEAIYVQWSHPQLISPKMHAHRWKKRQAT